MSIEVRDYKPLTPAEVATFVEDVRGVWQPSGNDQMRLLATVVHLEAQIAVANQTAREMAHRCARLAARLSVIEDQAREGMTDFGDWSAPATPGLETTNAD